MNKYKVFGDKVVEYYIDVESTSAEEAWDIASNAATDDWIQINESPKIEVHFVDDELQEETNLLEDGYPSMDNDVVIVDKSDNTDI